MGLSSKPSLSIDSKTLESIASINPESLTTNTPANFKFQYIDISSVSQGVIDWGTVTTHSFSTAPSRARRIVRPNDILLCTVRPALQSHTFADWKSNENNICSTGFAVIRASNSIDPHYLYHLIFHPIVADQLRKYEIGSNYPAVNETDIRQIRILVPDVDEQRLIADILNALDMQVQQTEALIAKLKQLRIGLLHDLLTRGIDENGDVRDPVAHPEEFKESKVGKIPQEWEILQIKDIGTVQLGRQRSPRYQTGKNTTPYLRVANVFDGWIDYSDVLQMDFTPEERAVYYLTPGDILLNEGQSLELVGRSAIYKELPHTYCFQNTLVRFRCNLRTIPEYCLAVFKYWLDIGKFTTVAKQTTSIAHLGADRFAQMSLFVPSPDEQYRIVAALNAHDSRTITEKALLTKLKQLKKGLMDDLLTGRVRVTELITDDERMNISVIEDMGNHEIN